MLKFYDRLVPIERPANFPMGWKLMPHKLVKFANRRKDVWVNRMNPGEHITVESPDSNLLCWVKEYTPVGETAYHFYDPKEAHAFYVSRIDTCPLCDYEEGTA